MKQFFGKFRGTVLENLDPAGLGRVQVMVPAVLGEVPTAWAMPCVPYAGLEQGFCFAPPVGAAVWIEFEGGDPDYPIWAGCFWQVGERPPLAELPETRLIKTATATLLLNDVPGEGGFTLSTMDPAVAVPVTIAATSAGLSITVAETSIAVNETGITMVVDPAMIQLGPAGVTILHGAATIVASEPEVVINEGSLTVL